MALLSPWPSLASESRRGTACCPLPVHQLPGPRKDEHGLHHPRRIRDRTVPPLRECPSCPKPKTQPRNQLQTCRSRPGPLPPTQSWCQTQDKCLPSGTSPSGGSCFTVREISHPHPEREPPCCVRKYKNTTQGWITQMRVKKERAAPSVWASVQSLPEAGPAWPLPRFLPSEDMPPSGEEKGPGHPAGPCPQHVGLVHEGKAPPRAQPRAPADQSREATLHPLSHPTLSPSRRPTAHDRNYSTTSQGPGIHPYCVTSGKSLPEPQAPVCEAKGPDQTLCISLSGLP